MIGAVSMPVAPRVGEILEWGQLAHVTALLWRWGSIPKEHVLQELVTDPAVDQWVALVTLKFFS